MRYFLILLFSLGLHTFSAGENKCGSLEKCDPYKACFSDLSDFNQDVLANNL